MYQRGVRGRLCVSHVCWWGRLPGVPNHMIDRPHHAVSLLDTVCLVGRFLLVSVPLG